MKIDLDYLKKQLKKQVPIHRYHHSMGVAEVGSQLAKQYGADPEKAKIAGILHDYSKYWETEKLATIIRQHKELDNDLLNYSAELWHGPVASRIIQQEFAIHDNEIINAIHYHTSGRENMSLLEKVVCLADYIEPTRNYPGVEQIRNFANVDLNLALIKALDGTIHFLIEKGLKVYPLTVMARNSLLEEHI